MASVAAMVFSCGLDARGTATTPDAEAADVDARGARDGGPLDGTEPFEGGSASDGVSLADANDARQDVTPAPVTHVATTTGTASGSTTVAASVPSGGGAGAYVVAVSTKPHRTVTSVTGLGLSWTLLDSQCGEDNQTGVSVWGAIGTAAANGTVTATLDSAPISAALALSRFSGATAFGAVRSAYSHGEEAQASCADDGDGDAIVALTVSPPPGALVHGAIAIRMRTHLAGAGTLEIDEIHEGSSGDAVGLAIVTTTGPSVSGTLSADTGWAGSAVTLLP